MKSWCDNIYLMSNGEGNPISVTHFLCRSISAYDIIFVQDIYWDIPASQFYKSLWTKLHREHYVHINM